MKWNSKGRKNKSSIPENKIKSTEKWEEKKNKAGGPKQRKRETLKIG